ncbi:MAG: hypothetical protein V7742_01290 [Halioglobus sp.]
MIAANAGVPQQEVLGAHQISSVPARTGITVFMRSRKIQLLGLCLLTFALHGCGSDSSDRPSSPAEDFVPDDVPPDESTVFTVANGCFAISPDGEESFLAVNEVENLIEMLAGSSQDASRFLFRPSDLGQYLVYDENKGYLVSDGEDLLRQTALASDTAMVDGEVIIQDRRQSEGEWQLLAAPNGRFKMQHIQSGAFINERGNLGDEEEAADLVLSEQQGCAEFPELSLDATGEVAVTEFDDGSVFGFVETHSHLFTNLSFGGGGVFHGAPFHPLGVEHALADCELSHGIDGRKDFQDSGFSGGGVVGLLPAILAGELPEKTHDTDGYPTFTSWPDAPRSSTHQAQYYKWLERAYKSGLRLLVQHATTQETLCEILVGIGAQPKRYDCSDMVAVDRILEETYALERYIDALSGGPGEGWFRIVFSPEEARQQIKAGKLAVVLGIETSDVFDCYLEPPEGLSKCTEADVIAKLDEYHTKGVRVLFPVHKMDNAFSAGDGDRRVDIGNFAHTGHYSNFIQCPEQFLSFPGGFDKGGVAFAALNQPREVYDSPPPIDVNGFEDDPVGFLFANLGLLTGGPLEGEYCQNHGITALGEFLMTEMMKRGMVIEVDHFPRKSYARAYEMLAEFDYPAVGTHGRNNNGILYQLGGMSKSNLGRCRAADTPATMDDGFQNRIQLMRDKGAFPAEGFGFDLGGFAGSPGPRFGARSNCADPQTDEGITYPFDSYAGDVTLEQPVVGNRTLDFNTEGMVHLGLVAELIEDVRRDGVSDEELEPLFKSAEGYLRLWEKSERRGRELNN